MELAHILAFNTALLVAIAVPGPSLLYLTRTTLEKGRLAGIYSAMGLAVMAATWTLAAVLGLDALFLLFPWAYTAMKTIGALYLIYLAWGTWKSARQPVGAVQKPSARRAFLGGFLVNAANPKSVFFAAAVLVVIFPESLSTGEKAFIVVNHLAIELVVQPLLAVGLSTPLITRRYLAAKPVLDRIAAVVLGALGARLLADR